MSDLEDAISRLTAWIRDYGDSKQPVFIADLTIVLLAAQAHLRDVAKSEQLLREYEEQMIREFGTDPSDRIAAEQAARRVTK